MAEKTSKAKAPSAFQIKSKGISDTKWKTVKKCSSLIAAAKALRERYPVIELDTFTKHCIQREGIVYAIFHRGKRV